MKGISHFTAGVAVASCLPGVVEAGASGNPLYFILGGVCGLLPDTIDFKFLRFFARHDVEVAPDPLAPDPTAIAGALAAAAEAVLVHKRPVRVKLDAITVAAGVWRPYEVFFDTARRAVRVRLGAIEDDAPDANADPAANEGEAPLPCDVRPDYMARITVDILDGPLLAFVPGPDNRVRVRFLPWHRAWSHSLPTSAALGLLAAAIWNPLAGLTACLAHAAHSLLDQTGFLGSRLFHPLSARHYPGWQWTHSGSALPNALVVWSACLLTLWNLSRAAPQIPFPNGVQLAVFGLLLPLGLARLATRAYTDRKIR